MNYINNDNLNTVKVIDKSEYPTKGIKHNKVIANIEDLFKNLNIKDGSVVSFHHHLRNGDKVLNLIMKEVQKLGVKDITLVASSLFPTHNELIPLLKDGTIKNIVTSYIAGELAEAISYGVF